MQKNDKAPTAPSPTTPPAATKSTLPKKKLTLDVNDVSEVLERKISP